MLVIGFSCLIFFGIWEACFAKKPLLPFQYLLDRTVAGSCLLVATTWIAFYCWDAYFNPYLQVVHDLSIKEAGYVANIYNLGSCFWAIVVGLLIRYTGGFKWLALAAVPFQILGTGLMIYFREPHWGIGYVVMTQIFIAFSGGTLVICQEVAIMSAVGPENIAVALALQGLFASVGGAIGSSISGAIWTNTFYQYLVANLPVEERGNAAAIYADITTQLKYPVGSPARTVMIEGYAHGQRYMCIAATAVLVLCFGWVLMWRDYRVKDFKAPVGAKVI
jgi:predicted MFS family arabinose efflux permease